MTYKKNSSTTSPSWPGKLAECLEMYFAYVFLVTALVSPVFLFSGRWELSMVCLAVSTFSAIIATKFGDYRRTHDREDEGGDISPSEIDCGP